MVSGHGSGGGDRASPRNVEAESRPSTAYVALGANLGDRAATIRHAVDHLRDLGAVDAVSPLYETDPVGYLDQPPFLNAVARLRTRIAPAGLLNALHRIEAEAGRVRTFRNAPRLLDLDLLFYDDLVRDDPALTLPHPRLHERAFVLVPLSDLAPDLVHPQRRATIAELLRMLGNDGSVRRFAVS